MSAVFISVFDKERRTEQTTAPALWSRRLWQDEGQQGICKGGQVKSEICVLSDVSGKGKTRQEGLWDKEERDGGR